ncbi:MULTISPECIES: hypothetical protein [Methanobacterium]|jgi:hypothetical protein|uniref:Uncharacterized protein n=1 Tax=Methanobacterium subterraneum TaxID=59277 RepID=A0A7K4DMB4_9EURY|nr:MULTISPECIES: hypothetical protein [Methanobacterium]AUB58457.1 hypothetical protein BK008_09120 [Methanobacterium sp. MZ-A1]MBW4257204.1 hypothetical protein [Methanobacterium sp. YSL]NMO09613.1 hypothetical protein [Methanobacterium subterraneum]PKL71531.1 MAG: hypothetical protein CVV29_10115 [Methanobacteriales archaeon HGW-Methanobacteriales-2]
MVSIKEFLYPLKYKVTLFLVLAIPCIALITLLIDNFIYLDSLSLSLTVDALVFLISIFLSIVIGLVLSYLLSCVIDCYIANEKIKIVIALISGITSLIIVYVFYKMMTEPIICDPVHIPANNQTVCDPVHQPIQGESYHTNVLDGLNVDKSLVEESFQECIQNLK